MHIRNGETRADWTWLNNRRKKKKIRTPTDGLEYYGEPLPIVTYRVATTMNKDLYGSTEWWDEWLNYEVVAITEYENKQHKRESDCV